MDKPKILYGICGIGSGHTERQQPLVEHFARQARMMIFGYGTSLERYSNQFEGNENVQVVPVSVPFYPGNRQGLDFKAALNAPQNREREFFEINAEAMSRAQDFLGKPDVVISDYEPVVAQYSYAKGSPLVTIDQQSKYLSGDFPEDLNGQTYKDEVERLQMFFPRVDMRIACSFFDAPQKENIGQPVAIYSPILKNSILGLKRKPNPDSKSILVYISRQKAFTQTLEEIKQICSHERGTMFHIFGANNEAEIRESENIKTYQHGDPRFMGVLTECQGIVSTAGHTLLSEAMHLGIPVYAMPLPLYEQEMNGHIIGRNNFGMSHPVLDQEKLSEFIREIEEYARNIRKDYKVLLRGSSHQKIIDQIERFLQ